MGENCTVIGAIISIRRRSDQLNGFLELLPGALGAGDPPNEFLQGIAIFTIPNDIQTGRVLALGRIFVKSTVGVSNTLVWSRNPLNNTVVRLQRGALGRFQLRIIQIARHRDTRPYGRPSFANTSQCPGSGKLTWDAGEVDIGLDAGGGCFLPGLTGRLLRAAHHRKSEEWNTTDSCF